MTPSVKLAPLTPPLLIAAGAGIVAIVGQPYANERVHGTGQRGRDVTQNRCLIGYSHPSSPDVRFPF